MQCGIHMLFSYSCAEILSVIQFDRKMGVMKFLEKWSRVSYMEQKTLQKWRSEDWFL